MREAVIVATARSPIGRAGKGSLVGIRPDDLGTQIVRAALDQVPELPSSEIDDIYVGCGEPYDEQGDNLARRIAVQLGLDALSGATVNRFCSSSVQTTRMAFHAIRAGEGDVFISAGVECVSRYADPTGQRASHFHNPLYDDAKNRTERNTASNEPWSDPRADGYEPDIYMAMGQTAENVASLRGISRAEQDEFAVRSQSLAEAAVNRGFYADEITPVVTPQGAVIDRDDCPRPGVTLEAVAALKPAFRPLTGTVTAGNCCPLNDGAAALIVTSSEYAAKHGITPLARIVATGVSALSPEIMGLGPVESSRRALRHAGMTIGDIDLVEINEAFAAQVIPSYRDLGIDIDRLNVNGGAIALGHPFGMTGARITTTLLHTLRDRDETFGLETMCVGGGQGMAMIVERLS